MINFFFHIVDIERGSRRSIDIEMLMSRLSTVMAGADGDPIGIQDVRNVMRVDAIVNKGEHAALVFRLRTVNLNTRNFFQTFECVGCQRLLVLMYCLHSQVRQVVYSLSKTDPLGDRTVVNVEITQGSGPGLFGDSWSFEETLVVEQDGAEWLIAQTPWPIYCGEG